MLDIGIQELLVLMVLALLIFGPDKLPDLGRRLGRAMREFRRASDEFRSTVEQNLSSRRPPAPRRAELRQEIRLEPMVRDPRVWPANPPARRSARTARDRLLRGRSSHTGPAGEGGCSTAANAPGAPGSPSRIALR